MTTLEAFGVTTQEEVDAGNVRIIAPEGFLEEVVKENIIAGLIMARRAHYQFGPLLPAWPQGQSTSVWGNRFHSEPHTSYLPQKQSTKQEQN